MYNKYVLYLSKWFNVLFHFLVNVMQFVFDDKRANKQTTELLKNCKQNTLGKALICCLQKHRLQIVPLFSTHDVKHILLGYKMTIIDEILMQCYMLGNGNKSPVTIGIAALGFHFPHLYHQMIWHYKQGKRAMNISHVNFYEVINEPLSKLRVQYKIQFIKSIS